MINMGSLKIIRPAAAGALILASCSGTMDPPAPTPEDGMVELKNKQQASVDTPEAELFANAKKYYQAGLFSVAGDSFEALRNGYPLGPYAEFAEIKIADTHFDSAEYSTAALAYEEFVKDRPASSAVPYAMLRAARSYQLANRGVGRDSTSLKKAVQLYSEVLRYPPSNYSAAAREWKRESEQTVAASEKTVIDFYKRTEKSPAYAARAADFEKQWGAKSEDWDAAATGLPQMTAQEAKSDRLPETPGPVRASINAPRLVRANRPAQSDSEIPSRQNIQDNGTTRSAITKQPAAAQGPALQETRRPEQSSNPIYTLRSVDCNAQDKIFSLTLSSPFKDKEFLRRNRVLNRTIGEFSVQIPGLRTIDNEAVNQDCFESTDLSITSNGILRFRSDSNKLKMLDMDSPARLIFAAE